MTPRRYLIVIAIAAGIIVLLAAWAAADVLVAHRKVRLAEQRVVSVALRPQRLDTADGRREADLALGEASTELDSAAHRLRRSVPISITRFVPVLRTQRSELLELIDDGSAAVALGRGVIATTNTLASAPVSAGTVPLDRLARLQATLANAANSLQPLVRGGGGLWGPFRSTRQRFDTAVTTASERLRGAADAIGAARSFMGEQGPRRYFIAALNNAEMRDQGMVLSYATITFDHGALRFEHSGSISELTGNNTFHGIPVPAGTQQVFGDLKPATQWRSINATPDFAWSGRAMVGLYGEATGQTVDGVIAVDVPALSYLLRIVGPVSVPGIPVPVTAENAATLLLKQLYDRVPVSDQSERHEVLAQVSHAVIDKLVTANHDVTALAQQLAVAAAQGHLRLYSGHQDEETTFEQVGVGGGPAVTHPERTLHVAVQNALPNKVDFYIRPDVAMEVNLTKLGTAVVRTTVTLSNPLPPGVGPSYPLGPTPGVHAVAGQYGAFINFWSPSTSSQIGGVYEAGLVTTGQTISVMPGESKTVQFEAVIPHAIHDGKLELRLVPQARLVAATLHLAVAAPGWKIEGPTQLSFSWAKTVTVTWTVHQ